MKINIYHGTSDSRRAFGNKIRADKTIRDAQGKGFYAWTSLRQAREHCRYSMSNPRGIVVSELDLSENYWFVDWEVHPNKGLRFLADNLNLVRKLPPIVCRINQGIIHPENTEKSSDRKSLIFRHEYIEGSSVYSDRTMEIDWKETIPGNAAFIGKIINRMQIIYPEVVNRARRGWTSGLRAVRYSGEELPIKRFEEIQLAA